MRDTAREISRMSCRISKHYTLYIAVIFDGMSRPKCRYVLKIADKNDTGLTMISGRI